MINNYLKKNPFKNNITIEIIILDIEEQMEDLN